MNAETRIVNARLHRAVKWLVFGPQEAGTLDAHVQDMSKHERAESEMRILREIANMPFGSLVTHKVGRGATGRAMGRPTPITLDDVANYLAALREVLETHVLESQERDRELEKFQQAQRGLAFLLGQS